MQIAETRSITIVGAGMAGALLAILLARRGFEVDLFEQHADPDSGERPVSLASNLALGERARHALRSCGLLEQVNALSTTMRGRMIHDRSGKLTLQPYGYHSYENLFSVRRESLQQCLLNEALADTRIRIHFERRLEDIDWEKREALFTDVSRGGTGARLRHRFEVLIGADGPASRVRRSMQQECDLGASEELLDAGYKFLSIPPSDQGEPVMDPNAVHVWPRGGYMLLAFPGPDASFTATLFLPINGDHRMIWGFNQLDSWVRQRAFMTFNFPDATALMPYLEQEFRENRIGKMGTVRLRQWHLDGHALLIGDAAHAIVPFHGQGVNSAFEDCTTLDEILEDGPDHWEDAFRQLQSARLENTNAIADMALDAYHTVRESVRHRDFLLRKALERELEIRHPGQFVARYSLVMFHRIPYTEAYERGRVQAGILDELLSGKQALAEVDLARASTLVQKRLAPLHSWERL